MEKAGRKCPFTQIQMIIEFDEIQSVFSVKLRFSSVVCKFVHTQNNSSHAPKTRRDGCEVLRMSELLGMYPGHRLTQTSWQTSVHL